MSPAELRVVLLILGFLVTDSALGDPCVTHTVLDQPWRSTNCSNTECTGGELMNDKNLAVRWYRFNSSGGWKIPETVVPEYHCSGENPGWLNGPHPNVGEGEVTRTVCFSKDENPCEKYQEIRVKNCSGYFVYRLEPTTRNDSVYCTVTDSALGDPCVNHTVLDQPWRSTDCNCTKYTGGQWKGDKNLAVGWYRFNSSGGWKIPETVVPQGCCCGKKSGWLNGPHPNVGEGEVTRTVCFSKGEKPCEKSQEIRVKNCSGYFVYRLWPTTGNDAVYCTVTDSTLGDPCVTHTVLDQPWRSTNCSNTECTDGQWMGDGNLAVGWYRFNSSGGWKIPETVIPQDHCSGQYPGWLNGPHPNVGEGEVTRTVCFTVSENTCYWSREIRVKNCSGYLVYRLGPTTGSNAVYCTDSALGDPCVTHTVLDQPWRSMNCSNTECTGGQWRNDVNLAVGWYRFNSSGGWKIPETVVPQGRCSGEFPGWLNGPHPNVGEGEVTRTACFTQGEDSCYRSQEIGVKNCSGYFVYRLLPAPLSYAVYCTDLEASTMDQSNGSSTGQPIPSPSSVSEGQRSSDSQSDTTQEPQGSATGGPGPGLSTTPAGSASSDPGTSTGKQFSKKMSSVPGGGITSDPGTSTGKQSEGSSTGDFSQETSSIPAGGATSGPRTSTGKQSERSSTGDFSQETSSVPARDTASDPLNSKGTSQKPSSGPEKETCSDLEASTMDEPTVSSTGQPTPSPSSVSAGETSSDSQLDTTRETKGSVIGKPGPGLITTPTRSASSCTDTQLDTTREPQRTATAEPGLGLTTTTAGSVSSVTDSQSDTTQEPHGSALGDFDQSLTDTPTGSVISVTDSQSETTWKTQGSVTGEPDPGLTTIPAGSASSDADSQSDTTHKIQITATGEPGPSSTTTPAGYASSGADPQSDTTQEAEVSAMGEHDPGMTTTLVRSMGSGTDSQLESTQEALGSAMGDFAQSLTSTSAETLSSGTDTQSDATQETQGSANGEPGPGLAITPEGSANSVTDSAISDPCVTHTVLDQPWRSMKCSNTECTDGQQTGDGNLDVGWYRFNSSGGWKIPETVVPQYRCSGKYPGWLNGSHPNVGEGEVTRTVCFTWDTFTCYGSQEIRVKNCSGYFVYWLGPTPWSDAVYCTDPQSDTTRECQASKTGEPSPDLSSTPAESSSSESDLHSDTTWEPPASTTKEPNPDLSFTPGSSSSEADPQSDTTQEPQGSATGAPVSDLEASTMDQPDGSSTGQPTSSPSSVSVGERSSDPHWDTTEEPQGTANGEPGLGLTTTPERSTSSDQETSIGEQPKGSTTEGHMQKPSSAPMDTSGEEDGWIDVQVTARGDMSEEEVREAIRNKLREMFDDPDPQIELVQCTSEPPEE